MSARLHSATHCRLAPRLHLRRDGAQHSPSIVADAFEALLGALCSDRGFPVAQAFCCRVLEAVVDWEQLQADAHDYKGAL